MEAHLLGRDEAKLDAVHDRGSVGVVAAGVLGDLLLHLQSDRSGHRCFF